jgi:hypothetical protein
VSHNQTSRGLGSEDHAGQLTEFLCPVHCSQVFWFRRCLTIWRKLASAPPHMYHVCCWWQGTCSKSNVKAFRTMLDYSVSLFCNAAPPKRWSLRWPPRNWWIFNADLQWCVDCRFWEVHSTTPCEFYLIRKHNGSGNCKLFIHNAFCGNPMAKPPLHSGQEEWGLAFSVCGMDSYCSRRILQTRGKLIPSAAEVLRTLVPRSSTIHLSITSLSGV